MMKKVCVSLLLVLLLSLLLVACGNKHDENGENGNNNTTDEGNSDNNNSHGHSFEDWIITKEANCYADGEMVRYCDCGEKQTQILHATGNHKEKIIPSVDPTCSEPGLTEGICCSVCGEVLAKQGIVPVIAHSYDDKYDESCNECGFIRDAECNHNETIVMPGYSATCTAPGLTDGEQCKKCEEIIVAQTVISVKGHNFGAWNTITTPTCNSLGEESRSCTCGKTEYQSIPQVGHCYTEGTFLEVVKPTATSEGKLTGPCKYCNKYVDYQLPALNKETYEVSVLTPSCLQNGSESYVYIDKAAGVHYEIVITTEATGHLLSGQNYTKYDIDGDNTNGIVVPFWYGDPDENGKFPALGVKEFADSPIACGNVGLGYFQCEGCREVIDVSIYKDHNGKVTNIRPSSCIASGLKDIECVACHKTIKDVVIPMLDHTWVTKLEANGHMYHGKMLFDLVEECVGNGLATDTCDARCVLEADITDVEEKIITAPTCYSEGIVEYSYIKDGVVNRIEGYIPTTSHVLDGVSADFLVNMDGTYDHTINGIKFFADYTPSSCGNITHGYYICEACDAPIYVNVIVVHVPTNPTITVEPTCTDAGEITYACEMCEKAIINEPVEALGHSKAYELVKGSYLVDGVEYKFALHTNCNRANCLAKDVEAVQYFVDAEEVAKVDPTCYSKGSVTYAVWVGGVEVSVTLTLAKNPHTLDGKFVTEYYYFVNGVIAIKSSVPGIHTSADDYVECGDIVHGYYVCEVCEAANQEETVVYVDVYMEHDLILSGEHYNAPTETESGQALCNHCGEIIAIPPKNE